MTSAAPKCRSGRTRQVQRARAELVGSERPVQTAARSQSAAAAIHRARRVRCREARSSMSAAAAGILSEAMARARCPGARHRPLAGRPRGRRTARRSRRESTVEYRSVAAEELALERPGAFDAVTCMEMLEHVPDPAAALAALGASGEARRRCHRVDLESHTRRHSPWRFSAPNTSRAFCRAARTST